MRYKCGRESISPFGRTETSIIVKFPLPLPSSERDSLNGDLGIEASVVQLNFAQSESGLPAINTAERGTDTRGDVSAWGTQQPAQCRSFLYDNTSTKAYGDLRTRYLPDPQLAQARKREEQSGSEKAVTEVVRWAYTQRLDAGSGRSVISKSQLLELDRRSVFSSSRVPEAERQVAEARRSSTPLLGGRDANN
ncbi:hypothetical protein H6P81_004857 [Aristolochia fimbriata]|uniref:Uncharacterized protein n=1 Tax=Aristolochia fimbriata TaxID=158543 RepID=A0AAV7EXB9_ARIFI|nr:hypothetical protein H6P81_004857 [Aristolochia fimbriata]